MSSPPNVGVTGSGIVTIGGLGFGGLVVTPSASLAMAELCGSTAWTSATTVACGLATYGGSIVRTAVSVGAVAGTLMMFSFDCMDARMRSEGFVDAADLILVAAPVVSFSSLDNSNLAKSAGLTVTISGLGFGASNVSTTSSLTTSDSCLSTAWTSITTVTCAPRCYSAGAQRTSVITRGAASTGTTLFTFDGIHLSNPSPSSMSPLQ
jgi:hypothetical protein